jgi:hypothetical protein
MCAGENGTFQEMHPRSKFFSYLEREPKGFVLLYFSAIDNFRFIQVNMWRPKGFVRTPGLSIVHFLGTEAVTPYFAQTWITYGPDKIC